MKLNFNEKQIISESLMLFHAHLLIDRREKAQNHKNKVFELLERFSEETEQL